MAETKQSTFMPWAPISDLNNELVGIVCSVRELDARISEEQLAGTQVKEAFAEMFPPATLFHPAIQTMPAIYPALRNWLNQNGSALTPHSSHRIIMTLASSVYSDSEDTNAAMEIAREMTARSRTRPTLLVQSNTQTAPENGYSGPSGLTGRRTESHKVAHNIAMRFRQDSSKFTLDLGES